MVGNDNIVKASNKTKKEPLRRGVIILTEKCFESRNDLVGVANDCIDDIKPPKDEMNDSPNHRVIERP